MQSTLFKAVGVLAFVWALLPQLDAQVQATATVQWQTNALGVSTSYRPTEDGFLYTFLRPELAVEASNWDLRASAYLGFGTDSSLSARATELSLNMFAGPLAVSAGLLEQTSGGASVLEDLGVEQQGHLVEQVQSGGNGSPLTRLGLRTRLDLYPFFVEAEVYPHFAEAPALPTSLPWFPRELLPQEIVIVGTRHLNAVHWNEEGYRTDTDPWAALRIEYSGTDFVFRGRVGTGVEAQGSIFADIRLNNNPFGTFDIYLSSYQSRYLFSGLSLEYFPPDGSVLFGAQYEKGRSYSLFNPDRPQIGPSSVVLSDLVVGRIGGYLLPTSAEIRLAAQTDIVYRWFPSAERSGFLSDYTFLGVAGSSPNIRSEFALGVGFGFVDSQFGVFMDWKTQIHDFLHLGTRIAAGAASSVYGIPTKFGLGFLQVSIGGWF